jgi:hypothetical protein
MCELPLCFNLSYTYTSRWGSTSRLAPVLYRWRCYIPKNTIQESLLMEYCSRGKSCKMHSTYLGVVYLDSTAAWVDVRSVQRFLGSLRRFDAVEREVQLRNKTAQTIYTVNIKVLFAPSCTCTAHYNLTTGNKLRLLWNPKVHYRILNSTPLVAILNLTNSVHTFPPSFPYIYSNNIFPPTPRSSAWSLPFRFSH